MIYRIEYVGEGRQKKKLAHPVKDRKALLALRNSKTNLNRLEKARAGDSEAKSKLLQLAYNIGHVEGLIAGCKSLGSFFFHDVDCYDKEQSEAIKHLILSKKEEIGLMMLEQSVSGGWHLVCKRELGKTILENQVRVASVLKLEMDTNTKDLTRVCFSTSGSEEDLPYLDDALFEEPLSPEECEKEFQVAKERERKKLEEVPKGAKKANKHYRPWEDEGRTVEEGRTLVSDPSFPSCARLPVAFAESERLHLGQTPSEPDDIPIVISSGYRSEEVNRKCGGAKGSNHLTGCAVDIRCYGPEHMIRMAGILLDIADGTKREFDELIMEQRGTTCWIHFAVRRENGPATQGAACQRKNRRKILFDCR